MKRTLSLVLAISILLVLGRWIRPFAFTRWTGPVRRFRWLGAGWLRADAALDRGRVRFRSIKMAAGRTGEQVVGVMRAQQVLVVAIVVCGLALAAPGSAEDHLIDTERSTVTVRVFKSGLFRAFADDHIIQAPLAEGSLDDSVPHVQIVIDARRLHVLDPGLSARDRQQVQTRMLGSEVLDVSRFQRISFHSLAIQRLDTGGWLVQGELELHGQIRAITVNVRSENSRYKGSATLRQSDFWIAPISILGGTVKVKDEIKVDFDIALEPAPHVF